MPSVLVVLGYVAAFVLISQVLVLGMAVGVAYGVWAASGVALVPELRPAARLWLDAAREPLSRWTTDEATLRAALALCDGVLLQGLIADEPPGADEIARVFEPVLGR